MLFAYLFVCGWDWVTDAGDDDDMVIVRWFSLTFFLQKE